MDSHPAGAEAFDALHQLLLRDPCLAALRRRIITPATEIGVMGIFKLFGRPLPGRTLLQHLSKVTCDLVPRHAATIAAVYQRLACAGLDVDLSPESEGMLRTFTGECLIQGCAALAPLPPTLSPRPHPSLT